MVLHQPFGVKRSSAFSCFRSVVFFGALFLLVSIVADCMEVWDRDRRIRSGHDDSITMLSYLATSVAVVPTRWMESAIYGRHAVPVTRDCVELAWSHLVNPICGAVIGCFFAVLVWLLRAVRVTRWTRKDLTNRCS